MGLLSVAVRAAIVTLALLLVGTGLVLGRPGVRRARRHLRPRLRSVGPHLLLLAVVLGINQVLRTVGPELSWLIGWNITNVVYAIEGDAVVHLQSFTSAPLTAYFSFVYLYGYAFLVVFPFVAYFAAVDPRPLKTTAVAYALNYAIGAVAYVLFIAYGPRNFMPEAVESLLYTTYPQVQLLTREVNVNTNVFPSLHSSLSVTVAVMAWRTRDVYPRWATISAAVTASVVVATMYLGIHWAIDVVAGTALALGSVYLAERWLARRETRDADVRGLAGD